MRPFIPFTHDQQIVTIGEGLRNKTLPKNEWTHAAHFAAALWMLSRHCLDEALAHMPGMIRSYNEHCGRENTDTSGYHETITVASLRAANAFRAERIEKPLFAVANDLLRSPLGDPQWLLSYWTRERLFSVAARRRWVEPDLCPLPF